LKGCYIRNFAFSGTSPWDGKGRGFGGGQWREMRRTHFEKNRRMAAYIKGCLQEGLSRGWGEEMARRKGLSDL